MRGESAAPPAGLTDQADVVGRLGRLELLVHEQIVRLEQQAKELRELRAASRTTSGLDANDTSAGALGGAAPSPVDAVCRHPERALRVQSNVNAGWGNRIGWWLTAAAVGESLNKSVLTVWRHTTVAGHCCDYDVPTVQAVVGFPRVLRVLDAASYAAANAASAIDEIPWHPRPYLRAAIKLKLVSTQERLCPSASHRDWSALAFAPGVRQLRERLRDGARLADVGGVGEPEAWAVPALRREQGALLRCVPHRPVAAARTRGLVLAACTLLLGAPSPPGR